MIAGEKPSSEHLISVIHMKHSNIHWCYFCINNIIYVACITYKQIGGSKQYVQPGAIGIFSVLCSLNHAVLGEKCIGKKS